jgi:glutathione S-transferase
MAKSAGQDVSKVTVTEVSVLSKESLKAARLPNSQRPTSTVEQRTAAEGSPTRQADFPLSPAESLQALSSLPRLVGDDMELRDPHVILEYLAKNSLNVPAMSVCLSSAVSSGQDFEWRRVELASVASNGLRRVGAVAVAAQFFGAPENGWPDRLTALMPMIEASAKDGVLQRCGLLTMVDLLVASELSNYRLMRIPKGVAIINEYPNTADWLDNVMQCPSFQVVHQKAVDSRSRLPPDDTPLPARPPAQSAPPPPSCAARLATPSSN